MTTSPTSPELTIDTTNECCVTPLVILLNTPYLLSYHFNNIF
ncbi:hypothetical protein [Candidatus Tisiphia endosymbiont of Sialis lutaria]